MQRAVFRHRVRSITDGSVDLVLPGQSGPGPLMSERVTGAVVDGVGYYQTAEMRGLGPALRWASSSQADRLELIAESAVAPALARRATLLDADIKVWSADGPEVVAAQPVPGTTPPDPPPSHQAFASVITDAGARPVNDHGRMVAEVAGLEVARVVEGPIGNRTEPTDGPYLAVGVGQADRELQDYVHGHFDDLANLRRAVEAVVQHRKPGSASHPLSRLARQRWLRSVLLDDPGLLGLPELIPLPPLRPRTTVLDDEPSAAVCGLDGPNPVIVVCSVGADLDLLPEAADYRHVFVPADPGGSDRPGALPAELVLVTPDRDRRLSIGDLDNVVPRLRIESIELPWGSAR